MPRAIATDPYQGYQFEVVFPGEALIEGGFTTAVTPELTVEGVEYKTGLMKMKQKYPGIATVNDITLTRGVVRANSQLLNFVRKTQSGEDYRVDFALIQKHKDGSVQRIYKIYNAYGIRCKVATDLDANAADISLEEMDIQFEDFDIEEKSA
jgi:phage tail-like protein